jgi:hypothetical protein
MLQEAVNGSGENSTGKPITHIYIPGNALAGLWTDLLNT